MLAQLAEIAERTDEENFYLGTLGLRRAEEKLRGLPVDAPLNERWVWTFRVALNELRLGANERAIERFIAARDLAVRPGDPDVPTEQALKPKQVVNTLFQLAVAYLRLGEQQNCVAMHSSESCILPIRGSGVHQVETGSRQAIDTLLQVLERDPDHLGARWLLNIAHMTLGEYPKGVAERWRIPPEAFDSEEDFPRFREVAADLGVNPVDLSGGSIADDFDGDGDLDLVTSTIDTRGQMRYYVNHGDGTFTERTTEAGLDGMLGGINLVQADYDNDGDLDVLVPRGAWFGQGHPDSLLRNDGVGENGSVTFTDVAFEAGLAQKSYPNQAAGWADYDNDGDLDLFLGNEQDQHVEHAPCQLFRNNGLGADGRVTFTDVASEAGVENGRYAKAVAWGDYDNDRFPDLYVSNRDGENRLYHNNGVGADGRVTFTDVAPKLGLTDPKVSFNSWFWDYDNDGDLDLYVATYEAWLDAVAAGYMGLDSPRPYQLAALYRNDGDGGFRDVAADSGLDRITVTMGSNYGDADNDGYLDMYLGTGNIRYEALMPNLLYRNRGGTGFADVTTAAGVGHLQKGHGVSFADLDNDGDQDIYIQLGGGVPGDVFGNALFENPGNGNHWLKVRLVGVESNRSAIGARLRLELREEGKKRAVYREVTSGGNFGANPLRQEIGLGRAEVVDVLEVFWPYERPDPELRGSRCRPGARDTGRGRDLPGTEAGKSVVLIWWSHLSSRTLTPKAPPAREQEMLRARAR